MLYSDLILGFTRVVLYFTFIGIMIKIHTFPLFAIRPIYLALRSFKKCLSDVVLSRRAISNLNNLYPDITAEQLSNYSDTICIICREEMTAEHQIKKLPCDHIFHKNCLRSWFQRQQTCPTCRTSILRINSNNQQQAQNHQQPQAQPAPPHQQQPQQQVPRAPSTPQTFSNTNYHQNTRTTQDPSQLPQMADYNFNPQLFGNIIPPFSKSLFTILLFL
jgi:E3 ubiquitin-protein ligase synoviolin